MNTSYNWEMLKAVVARKNRQDNLMNVLEKIPIGLNLLYRLVLNALKRRVLSWSRFSQTGIS